MSTPQAARSIELEAQPLIAGGEPAVRRGWSRCGLASAGVASVALAIVAASAAVGPRGPWVAQWQSTVPLASEAATNSIAELPSTLPPQVISSAAECGSPGNNGGSQVGATLSATSTCDCAEQCTKYEGCAAWTLVTGTAFMSKGSDGKELNCYLRSEFGPVVNNCVAAGGNCWSGHVGQLTTRESDWAAKEVPCKCIPCGKPDYTQNSWPSGACAPMSAMCSPTVVGTGGCYSTAQMGCNCGTMLAEAPQIDNGKAIAKKTVANGPCSKVLNATGSMTDIAGANFIGTAEWPTLNSEAYTVISKCVTAPGACEVSNPQGIDDMRSTYAAIVDTPVVDIYLSRLTNSGLMTGLLQANDMSSKADEVAFQQAVAQLGQELTALKAVGSWYNVYMALFTSLGSEMSLACDTMLTVLAMPHDQTPPIPPPKKGWKAITLNVLDRAANTMLLIGTDGASEGLLAAGASMKAALNVGGQVAGAMNTATTTTAPWAGAQDDELSLRYDAMLEFIQVLLLEELVSISKQTKSIAANWGRLKSAVTLVEGCPISANMVETVSVSNFPMLQWFALGILFPTKYAIYWQRDYQQGNGPTCEVPSVVYQPEFTAMDVSSQYTCSINSLKSMESGANNCYGEPGPCGDTKKPTRSFWIAAAPGVGAVDDYAPDSFFEALTATNGVVTRYVNAQYNQDFSGTTGGLAVFGRSCQCLTKNFVAASASMGMVQGASSSQALLSQQAVYCDIYDLVLPTYVLSDCEVMNSNDQICVNGFGQTGFTSSSSDLLDPHSGNFNQYVFVPAERFKWSSDKAGKYGCCLPWVTQGKDEADSLPEGCDFAVCDCWAMVTTMFDYQAGGKGAGDYYLDSGSIPHAWAGNCAGGAGGCQGYTSTGCSWTDVLESGDGKTPNCGPAPNECGSLV